MTNYHDEDIDIFSDDFLIAKDSYIRMKCTNCGYEEEADYLIEIGDNEPPCFQCPKCHEDTLYRKRQNKRYPNITF